MAGDRVDFQSVPIVPQHSRRRVEQIGSTRIAAGRAPRRCRDEQLLSAGRDECLAKAGSEPVQSEYSAQSRHGSAQNRYWRATQNKYRGCTKRRTGRKSNKEFQRRKSLKEVQ